MQNLKTQTIIITRHFRSLSKIKTEETSNCAKSIITESQKKIKMINIDTDQCKQGGTGLTLHQRSNSMNLVQLIHFIHLVRDVHGCLAFIKKVRCRFLEEKHSQQ